MRTMKRSLPCANPLSLSSRASRWWGRVRGRGAATALEARATAGVVETIITAILQMRTMKRTSPDMAGPLSLSTRASGGGAAYVEKAPRQPSKPETRWGLNHNTRNVCGSNRMILIIILAISRALPSCNAEGEAGRERIRSGGGGR